ncbi:ZPR1 zinc-finger domain-containing protein [Penicillium macrosclerotiorum]|uniref:ZPR1 zinc-finger domain-containing protein n=1 Tax=Penicillium macrosclerotiorum TaxID=303699 RepID=UPI0025497753|nr:ZPR1 zinc-finger domain-containing protein [Penicillium macrosclerotiorum]KAJ5669413.1 ZPR1 zinc-finger domain-containing protein [Penicillium macrosclerotiorum]
MSAADKPESQFQNVGDLVEQNEDTGVMQVESLCMNCHENGTTRLLLLRVPFFRDLILESFECPHCYFKNNSVKSAGQIQELGSKYTLEVENVDDLQRQVIRSDVAIFKIETLGIEMPKEGQLTNVEGLVQRIHESLSGEQPLRKEHAPEVHDALEPLIQKLKDILDGTGFPFTVSLDDPTGNSWIAPNTLDKGNKYKRTEYPRTPEQNEELGLSAETEPSTAIEANPATGYGDPDDLDLVDGVYTLPAHCPGCAKDCVVNMQKISIPHFKEVFIWATVCAHCGYKSNEVKTGGEIPEKGKKITLSVENEVDLSRDVLKSNTCAMYSEELELEVQCGTLGSRFTTIEGILTEIRDQLSSTIYDIEDTTTRQGGDSMPEAEKGKWAQFFSRLDKAISGELKFVITLVDPLANSYVQDLCAPAADLQLKVEEYTRTEEEEDDLGLKDMKTEGYEEDAKDEEEKEQTEEKSEDKQQAVSAMDDMLDQSMGK